MSTTDGVNGNTPPSIHFSFQSSMERKEARGAAGLARIRAQAASFTVIRLIPGGPPRHFWAAATAMSTCQSSVLNSIPPSDETQSTIVIAPCARAIGPIAARSCIVPDGVSEWTTVTRSISGCSSRYRSTSAGSTESL
jgi:hypothetical protein